MKEPPAFARLRPPPVAAGSPGAPPGPPLRGRRSSSLNVTTSRSSCCSEASCGMTGCNLQKLLTVHVPIDLLQTQHRWSACCTAPVSYMLHTLTVGCYAWA